MTVLGPRRSERVWWCALGRQEWKWPNDCEQSPSHRAAGCGWRRLEPDVAVPHVPDTADSFGVETLAVWLAEGHGGPADGDRYLVLQAGGAGQGGVFCRINLVILRDDAEQLHERLGQALDDA